MKQHPVYVGSVTHEEESFSFSADTFTHDTNIDTVFRYAADYPKDAYAPKRYPNTKPSLYLERLSDD